MRFFRRGPLDDFLEAIGPELRELPSPAPTPALRDRIIASRAAGVRTMLPAVAQPRATPRRSVAAVVIAAAVLVTLVPLGVRRTNPGAPRATDAGPGFLGALAYAQGTRSGFRPALAPVTVAPNGKARAMSLAFSRVVRSASGQLVNESRIELGLSAETIADVAAWRIVLRDQDNRPPQPHVAVETTYLARSDMRLLQRAIHVSPYSRYQRINVWQRFAGDSITGGMRTDGPGSGPGRSIARLLPRTSAPFMTESSAHAFLMDVPLAKGWSGSASLLGWAVRDDDVLVPIELRVEGEETVIVPAGRFDCWRVSIRYAGKQLDYWARKSDHLGVRVLDRNEPAKGTRELVLVSER